jgi:hypothetical protein
MNTIAFFNQEDLSSLTRWANKRYDAGNPEHVAAKNHLMATVWAKTAHWAQETADDLDGFDTWNWRMWNMRDWVMEGGQKVMIAAFKPYTWARIYRDGQKDRNIFFTVGVDPFDKPGLLIKLDYMYEGGTNLSMEQKDLCYQRIQSRVPPLVITPKEWTVLDWPRLIERTTKYIQQYTTEYDSLVEDVWGGRTPAAEQRDTLFLREMPSNGYASVPEYNGAQGIGDDELDEALNEAKELGDAGEDLVVMYESRTLRIAGFPVLADGVRRVKVGLGYDVLSFKPDGTEKHIEVKTTRGGWKSAFFMSRNERRYLSDKSNPVVLYRLYKYNAEKNTAEYLIIDDIEEALLFTPTAFAVYPKKKS